MFDVSFSELMVIAVVALVVIGPERLPKVARTVGHLLGRLQRYVTTVKADINREMQLEELKRLQQQVSEQVRNVESGVSGVTHEIRELESSLNASIAPPESAVPPVSTAELASPTGDAAPAASEASEASEASAAPLVSTTPAPATVAAVSLPPAAPAATESKGPA